MHGQLEVLQRQLYQRGALDTALRHGDGVQRNIKAARLLHDVLGVGFDSFLVHGIDHRGLRCTAVRHDLLGDSVERGEVSPGEEDPSPVMGKLPCHCGTNRARAAIDHGVLVFQ